MSKKNKLTLCVITGNNESRIDNFLESFWDVADEAVVVRACGKNEPDNTLAIAKDWGCVAGEYHNKDHPEWAHVDNFAAARNVASALATNEWLMWADTDDSITAESIQSIRELMQTIDQQGADGVLMRYVVPEDGVINWRERIWRKGKARWINPIHECLQFDDGAKMLRFEDAEIVHSSGPRHKSRDERNLRILESIPKESRTVSQKFHHFQSLIALDMNDAAIQSALEFVQTPDTGRNEHYEALFQLGRLAATEDNKRQLFLQALATDPSRPEAYFELGLAHCMDSPDIAEAWTAAAMTIKEPDSFAPWNLRRAYFGHLGVSIRAMSLRACNRRDEADALEQNHFILNGGKISLLHATRGRAAQAWRTKRDWLAAASNPDAIEHIFALDADDPHAYPLLNARSVLTNGDGGPVAAWNLAAAASSGQVLIQLSDDFRPFQGWDVAVLDAIGNTDRPAVLAVGDGHRKDDLLCMAILTRKRLEQQGYLFHPEFFSMFSDNWFSLKAFQDGCIIDARDKITFEHMHPAFGKGALDETYERSNASYHYQCGEGIYKRLRSGERISSDIQGWFDFRQVYDYVAQTIPDGGHFVEVGAWKGKSCIYLRDRLDDVGKIKTIVQVVDTFKGDDETGHVDVYDEFSLNRGPRNIFATVGDSISSADEVDDKTVHGIFIDGAHDFGSALADIKAWLPKLRDGGFFGGHDVDAPGVAKALAELGIQYKIAGRCWIMNTQEQ